MLRKMICAICTYTFNAQNNEMCTGTSAPEPLIIWGHFQLSARKTLSSQINVMHAGKWWPPARGPSNIPGQSQLSTV